jgi:hypothetical protein
MDFSTQLSVAVLFLGFSVPLCLCGDPTCLLEPVRARRRIFKQIKAAAHRGEQLPSRSVDPICRLGRRSANGSHLSAVSAATEKPLASVRF